MVVSEGALTRSIAAPAITLFVLASGATPGVQPRRGFHVLSKGFSPQRQGVF